MRPSTIVQNHVHTLSSCGTLKVATFVAFTIGSYAQPRKWGTNFNIATCKESDMIIVQRKRCVLCVCGKKGEKRKHKIDKQEKNEVLKTKVYIHKENTNYKM